MESGFVMDEGEEEARKRLLCGWWMVLLMTRNRPSSLSLGKFPPASEIAAADLACDNATRLIGWMEVEGWMDGWID